VLALDPRIEALDGRHIQNWWNLAIPPSMADQPPRVVLLILERRQLRHAVEVGRGALSLDDIPFAGTGREALATTRRKLDADAVFVLERDALARLGATVEGQLHYDWDMPRQIVEFWKALRSLRGDAIWADPPLLDLIPPLRSEALQRTFDLLIPNGTSLAAYVIDDDRKGVYSSIIATKNNGDIESVVMHPAIAHRVAENELARDWRQRYRRVNDAIGECLAPPSLSIFLERATVRKILLGPPDTLSREITAGNVVLDPAPAWLLGLIGGAAVAAVATRSARSVARFLPKSARRIAGDLAGAAQERIKGSAADPFALLGFDPIELIGQLRSYYK
jgi:hypothetical protein